MSEPRRTPLAALALLVWLFACPRSEPAEPNDVESLGPMATAASQADAAAISGTYEVRGVTVQSTTGHQRDISGTVELSVQGQHYEVSFDLATTAPEFDEPVPVRVRGSGRGFIVGSVLTGTTEEWMALEAAPEELGALSDVRLPARAGLKIVSTSQASFDERGVFQILLQNYPAPGQRYLPSMTVLAGTRVAEAPTAAGSGAARIEGSP